jgi:hypothetical protein
MPQLGVLSAQACAFLNGTASTDASADAVACARHSDLRPSTVAAVREIRGNGAHQS